MTEGDQECGTHLIEDNRCGIIDEAGQVQLQCASRLAELCLGAICFSSPTESHTVILFSSVCHGNKNI